MLPTQGIYMQTQTAYIYDFMLTDGEWESDDDSKIMIKALIIK